MSIARGAPTDPRRVERLRELMKTGLSVRRAAAEAGMPRSTAQEILRRLGVRWPAPRTISAPVEPCARCGNNL